MRTFLVAFLMALGISAVTTPLVLHLARRWGLLDSPDGVRKIHTTPMPRLGGIAIAAGFLMPIIALLFYSNFFSLELRDHMQRVVSFGLGVVGVLALGIYDDIKGCTAWTKLAGQGAVGILIWQAGLRLETISLAGQTIDIGLWSLPLTMLWVAGFVNAMNLIDGLDGLAAGVAFFAALSLFITAMIDSNLMLGLFAAAIGGSVLGFLFYNFSPALIFMGDSGSMTIGFIFAAAGLWGAGKRATVLAVGLPILALGLPMLDTTLAFVRRALRGKSPFHSDRQHIHHRLLDAGLSQRQAVLTLYLVCSLLTGFVVLLRVWAR